MARCGGLGGSVPIPPFFLVYKQPCYLHFHLIRSKPAVHSARERKNERKKGNRKGIFAPYTTLTNIHHLIPFTTPNTADLFPTLLLHQISWIYLSAFSYRYEYVSPTSNYYHFSTSIRTDSFIYLYNKFQIFTDICMHSILIAGSIMFYRCYTLTGFNKNLVTHINL